jgi:hypothetical protein
MSPFDPCKASPSAGQDLRGSRRSPAAFGCRRGFPQHSLRRGSVGLAAWHSRLRFGISMRFACPHRALGFGPCLYVGIHCMHSSPGSGLLDLSYPVEISTVSLASSTTGFRRQLEPVESACGIRQLPQPPRDCTCDIALVHISPM